MKNLAAVISALVLAAGAAQASGNGTNNHNDMPTAPVTAQNPVQVQAADALSETERARRGLDAQAEVTVSDFSAPGPRSTYTR